MVESPKYEFKEHRSAKARTRSAIKLVMLLLQSDSEILPEHRDELLSIALWKITEAESANKHRTRFCSRDAFESPKSELRHDHVFQRSHMVKQLLMCGLDNVEAVLNTAVGCTITKEEHLALNQQKHLDGWQRYKAADIVVIDTKLGCVLQFP